MLSKYCLRSPERHDSIEEGKFSPVFRTQIAMVPPPSAHRPTLQYFHLAPICRKIKIGGVRPGSFQVLHPEGWTYGAEASQPSQYLAIPSLAAKTSRHFYNPNIAPWNNDKCL